MPILRPQARRIIQPALYGAAAAGGNWSTLIPQTGLIHAWPFDTAHTTTGTGTDTIGANNVTFTSVTLNGSGPSANLNNAVVFNGTTSKGNTTGLTAVPTNFSITWWVQTLQATGNPNMLATDNTGGSSNNGIKFYAGGGTSPVTFCGNGTTSVNGGSGLLLTASTWVMLTVTFDGTNIRTYKNGVLGTTNALTGPVTAGAASLGFGYNPQYSGDFFHCLMAGIAMYNRVLTGTEVSTIFGL